MKKLIMRGNIDKNRIFWPRNGKNLKIIPCPQRRGDFFKIYLCPPGRSWLLGDRTRIEFVFDWRRR